MRKIIYTRVGGGLSVVGPSEGARFARYVTLSDGGTIPPDGKELVGFARVDMFLRRWPVDGATAEWAETEDEFMARIAQMVIPADASNVRIVDESEIPSDRTFRNAWKSNGGVEVDMPKAREIHKDALRRLRDPLLEALDVEYQRADEAKDQVRKDEIAEEKQALRDVTDDPAIDAATTPEELKAVMPDVLVPDQTIEQAATLARAPEAKTAKTASRKSKAIPPIKKTALTTKGRK